MILAHVIIFPYAADISTKEPGVNAVCAGSYKDHPGFTFSDMGDLPTM